VLSAHPAWWPWSAEQGPLPALLIVLTFLTGLVDGVSYLGLGHVFVANMTGNVMFLGFALAGQAARRTVTARPARRGRWSRMTG
jgi:hypothetical protein